MADTALKLAQIALEGPYSGGTINNFGLNQQTQSVYNGGSALNATRRLAIEKGMGTDFKYVWDAPEEARNTYAGAYQHVLEAVMAAGKVPSLIYCDDLVYYGRMTFQGQPTFVTLPNVPTVLLAATALAATMSLTTQPNAATDGAQAKILAVTLSSTGAAISSSVNVVITGTDIYNNILTETIKFAAGTTTFSQVGGGATATSCTSYTTNYFKTVNASGIAPSAQPALGQLAIGGVNAFMYTFLPDMATSTLLSATMEYFDGTGSWQLPGCVAEKLDVTMSIGKSMKSDMSFAAQQKAQQPLSLNPITAASQPGTLGAMTKLSDNFASAMTAYKTTFYSGAIGTDPAAATAITGRLTEYKFGIETGAKLGKAADGTPFGSFVGRGFYKVTGEATMLFNNSSGATYDPTDVGNFLYPTAASRVFRAVMPGPLLPCGAITQTANSSGWPQQMTGSPTSSAGMYGLIVDLAGKITEIAEKDVDGRAAFSFKIGSEVDLQFLQAQARMIVISRISPNAL